MESRKCASQSGCLNLSTSSVTQELSNGFQECDFSEKLARVGT